MRDILNGAEETVDAVTSHQNLVVWADPSVLAEAKNTFSTYQATVRPIPRTCRSQDLKMRVLIIYLGHAEPQKNHASFLECFKSRKVEFLLFYMPDHSSNLAFRWAIQNRTPIQTVAEGKTRDLIVEFLRLREG